jgi:two-component system, NarL family, sensor histidine kinase UhpB
VSGRGSIDPDMFRSLVEGVPAILYIDEVDDASTNLYTSPQVEEMLGFTPDEWRSDPDLWPRRLHPEDREAALAAHHESNATGARYHAEYRFFARDEREVWIRDDAILVRDDGGGPLYWRGVMTDITEQKKAEEKLRWSLDILRRTIQQRRELLRRLETAQEEERGRIAADIHDDPIQVMSAVDMRLQMMAHQDPASIDPADIADLHDVVQLAIERLRYLLFELRPLALDREGLGAALRVYLEHAALTGPLAFALEDGLLEQPYEELRATLFRIAQEAIVNVRKHARATRVEVTVEPVSTGVSLRVEDDGRGFDTARLEHPEPGHLGLATMVERAEIAGGWCRITSVVGGGTAVEVWVPLDADAEDVSRDRPA